MRLRLTSMLLLLLVTACGTSSPVPLERQRETLDFGEACRRAPASEVESQVRPYVLTNPFDEEMRITRLEIESAGAPVFWLDQRDIPATIAAHRRIYVPIRFLPDEMGPVAASLYVDLNDQPFLEVRLEGAGSERSNFPLMELSCAGHVEGTCSLKEPRIVFADTHHYEQTTALVQVHNPSCAKLVLYGLAVVPDPGTGEHEFMVSPWRDRLEVPSGETAKFPVWFQPQQVGATLAATLSFSSNAPSTPQLTMRLEGAGLPSRFRLEPESCDFRTDPPCPGRFSLVNSSSDAIELGSISLSTPLLPEDAGMFQIVRAAEPGTIIPAGGQLEDAVEVAYVPGREWQISLKAQSSAGEAVARLLGAVPPKAVVEPTRIDFGQSLEPGQDYYLPFTVTNAKQWEHQLPLTVGGLEVIPYGGMLAYPAFDLPSLPLAPCTGQIAAGTVVLAGKSVSGCVRFHAPEARAEFHARFEITSDDGYSYAVNDVDPLFLVASTTCNARPTARITVRSGTPCPCAEGEACISGVCHREGPATLNLTDTAALVLSGESSFDLMPDENWQCTLERADEVRSFFWSLKAKPEGSLAHVTQMSSPRTGLVADLAGTYTVELYVADYMGLSSEPVTIDVVAQ